MLRKLTINDLDDFYRLTSDPEVTKYMRFCTHTKKEESEKLLKEYIASGGFAVILKSEFAGVFVLKADEEPGIYSISTMLSKKFWNQGHTTTLLCEMLSYAKNTLKARRLRAFVVSDNAASIKTLEKNGFSILKTLSFPDLPCGLHIYEYEL